MTGRSAYDTALMHAKRAEAIQQQIAEAEARGDWRQMDALRMALHDAEEAARKAHEQAKAEGEVT